MDKIKESEIYKDDIKSILKQVCDWNQLKGKSIMITGATGLIGTVVSDMLIFLNLMFSLELKLFLISRHDKESKYDFVKYISFDISQELHFYEPIDYIIHAASNTHPYQYSNYPIETIKTNTFGTYNLLQLADKNPDCRFILMSSVEIYGNDINTLSDGFTENDFGYINPNDVRSCYNESKRLSETLCAAFASEKNIDYVICRLCRSYGPTIKKDDTKALSQFLRNAINGEDIILKSNGKQYYSYIYSADAASAIIFLMLNGISREAYNIADKKSNITLKDLALLIANYSNTKVIIQMPDKNEQKGYSKAQRAILNPNKIYNLGWLPIYNIQNGLERTIQYLHNS